MFKTKNSDDEIGILKNLCAILTHGFCLSYPIVAYFSLTDSVADPFGSETFYRIMIRNDFKVPP